MTVNGAPANASPPKGRVPEAPVQRRVRLAEEARATKTVRKLVTPEGAAIRLKLASIAERTGALLIDIAIQWAVVISTLLGVGYVSSAFTGGGGNIAFAVWLVFYFFVRNFYFILFEIGVRAATPGKRALGLRVAARNGGRLTANAVLARNFMREIEIGLPLQFLLMSGDQFSSWMAVFGLLWSGIFLLFPVFNKDKMRVGDLIAGTWVIRTPKAQLLGDISSVGRDKDVRPRFAFSQQQLDMYGIHELHVLEDVLRQSTADIKAQVAARIRTKIGWSPQTDETDLSFLEAYYASLRGRLEQRLIFGERKTDKFDVK